METDRSDAVSSVYELGSHTFGLFVLNCNEDAHDCIRQHEGKPRSAVEALAAGLSACKEYRQFVLLSGGCGGNTCGR